MKYTKLGRTDLHPSVIGLGTSENTVSEDTVRTALDHGVNFFDTAPFYGSEKFLGDYLPKSAIVATKTQFKMGYRAGWRTVVARTLKTLDASLRNLKRDTIDLYQLHRPTPATYATAIELLREPLLKEQQKGKIRFFGITENNDKNSNHAMVDVVCGNGFWDTVMVYAGGPMPHGKLDALKIAGRGSIAMSARSGGGTYAGKLAEGYDVVLTRTGSVRHLVENIKGVL